MDEPKTRSDATRLRHFTDFSPHGRCKVLEMSNRNPERFSQLPIPLKRTCKSRVPSLGEEGYKCGFYSALTSGKEWRKGTKRNAANKCLAALLIAVALDERGAAVVDFLLP